VEHTGEPTVILAKTIKGYGLGEAGELVERGHQVAVVIEVADDGLADRDDIVQRVQPRRQGMQHPQLRHGAQLVFLDGSADAVAGLDHPGEPGRGRAILS
jgi:hypothetical protein